MVNFSKTRLVSLLIHGYDIFSRTFKNNFSVKRKLKTSNDFPDRNYNATHPFELTEHV